LLRAHLLPCHLITLHYRYHCCYLHFTFTLFRWIHLPRSRLQLHSRLFTCRYGTLFDPDLIPAFLPHSFGFYVLHVILRSCRRYLDVSRALPLHCYFTHVNLPVTVATARVPRGGYVLPRLPHYVTLPHYGSPRRFTRCALYLISVRWYAAFPFPSYDGLPEFTDCYPVYLPFLYRPTLHVVTLNVTFTVPGSF